MYWNYRVLMLTDESIGQNKTYFEVCEVHYDKNDIPHRWVEGANVLVEGTIDELKESYEYINNAFKLPVLKVVGNKLIEVID